MTGNPFVPSFYVYQGGVGRGGSAGELIGPAGTIEGIAPAVQAPSGGKFGVPLGP